MELKTCTRCKADKPLEAFSVDRKRKDGVNVYCRDCLRAMRQATVSSPPATTPAFKKCSRCGELKPIAEFHIQSTHGPHARASACRKCTGRRARERREERMALDPIAVLTRGRERKTKYGLRNKRIVRDYLSTHPCVDCEESDPIVLEFDHVRGQKSLTVSLMVVQGYSVAKLMAEIAKCDVRCCNCHKRVTAKRAGWYAWLEDELAEPA